MMPKPLLTHILQHLMAQNQWASPILKPFAGQVVAVHIFPFSAHLQILEDGSLCVAGETLAAEATVTIPPSLLLRLLAQDETALSGIHIAGDSALAGAFGKVLKEMSWDIEADLSRLIGDIAAFQVVKLGKFALQSKKTQITNMAEMLSEYWQEENPRIAKKRHVQDFINATDALRDDTARLEVRLQKLLSKRAQAQTSP